MKQKLYATEPLRYINIMDGQELKQQNGSKSTKAKIASLLPKSLTKVTKFSKIVSMILFITFPFMGFYFGYKYHQRVNPNCDNRGAFQNSITSTPGSQKMANKLEVNNEELFSDPDLEKAWSSFDYFISKDEKWVVYRYNLGQGSSVNWLVNMVTKKKIALPSGYVFDGFEVNPDGTSIIKEQPSNQDRLCVSDSVTPVRKNLLNLGDDYQNVLPHAKFTGKVGSATWSKDNHKVVISELRLGEDGILWIANGDGSNAKIIAKQSEIGQGYTAGGIYWSGPGGYRWSDDDKSVWVFGNLKESVSSSGEGAVNIFTYDIASSKLEKYILPGSVYNFSPDQTLAVLYPGDTFGSNQVNIVNVLTKQVETYTFDKKVVTGPWSRDNKFLSINSTNEFGLISIDDKSTYLTFGTGAGTHQDDSYKWSCDSKRIYYKTRTQVKRLDIIN